MTPANTKDIVVTRVFDAPIERVWNAWIDGDEVKKWWGPTGFTAPVANMDFREGGTSLVCMRAPADFGGADYYNLWTYTKIVPMQSIEYVVNFADKDGNRVTPVEAGLAPNVPQDVRHVVTFKRLGENQTELVVTEFGYTDDQVYEMSKAGQEQCMDKLGASLKS